MKRYFLAFLFLPGTFVHELSHFLMAKLLFVPVGRFNLVPKSVGNRFQLGSVTIAKTDLIRESLIGLAPFLTGIFLLLILINQQVSVLSIYLMFQILHGMFLSFSDIASLLKLIILVLIVLLIFVIIFL